MRQAGSRPQVEVGQRPWWRTLPGQRRSLFGQHGLMGVISPGCATSREPWHGSFDTEYSILRTPSLPSSLSPGVHTIWAKHHLLKVLHRGANWNCFGGGEAADGAILSNGRGRGGGEGV